MTEDEPEAEDAPAFTGIPEGSGALASHFQERLAIPHSPAERVGPDFITERRGGRLVRVNPYTGVEHDDT